MLVHEALAKALAESGHSVLFGLIGDANMKLIVSFSEQDSCRYVPAASEGGAVLMASGYASVSGKVGLATVIKGPGLTNTITALTDAAQGSVPLLLIAVDTASGDWDVGQDIPQRDFVLPTGAGFEQLRTADSALFDLYQAQRRAITESRPIVLNVPRDLWALEVADDKPQLPPVTYGKTSPDPDELDIAVGLIASARRPVIIAGRGAATPESRDALLRLSQRIGAPVATTLRANSLFKGAPGDLGIFGTLSSDKTSEVIGRADVVIAFGASMGYRTTLSGELMQGKALVQVDTKRSVIGYKTKVNAAVVGDAGAVADSIVEWLDSIDFKATSFLTEVQNLTVSSTPPALKPSAPGTVETLDALVALEEGVPADRVLTVDTGRFMYSTLKIISVPEPRSYVHTAHLGSIGLGLGNAVGAAIAAPGRPTLLVTGDGGLMCSGMTEFRTAVTQGADLIVVVMNDRAYGAEYVKMEMKGMDPLRSTIDSPDFASVARAMGGEGFTVSDDVSLKELANVIANRQGPLLVDVLLDPAAVVKGAVPA